jgi:DNA-binding CsgD family transcriptional regulator
MRRLTASEIGELAQNAVSLGDFRQTILLRLQQTIGFDAACYHNITPGPLDRKTVLGVPEQIIPSSQGEYARRYTSLFGPVFGELKREPLAVDLDLFGQRGLREQGYFVDVLRPSGISHSLYSLVRFRDRAPALLSMGRASQGPLPGSLRYHFGSLLPVLAAADAGLSACEHGNWQNELTAKQRQLIGYVRAGLQNQEIANTLGISANTVRNRLATLFNQLGVRTRTELVARATSAES